MRPHLSKSRYLAGRQCLRRLWLACHAPELAEAPDAALAAVLEAGAEVGRRAHLLFPGGVLVEETGFATAAAQTRALLADPSVPAIFEGAFACEGVRIRVDVLERLAAGAWGLREVKSSSGVKEVHLDDVAVQRHVLEGCGLEVRSVELVHVDAGYVRGEGGIDWPRLFARVELADLLAERRGEVPARLRQMRAALELDEAPLVDPSPHCWTPYGCEFWRHCTREKPADWILHLPSLRPARLAALHAAGVERITEIPAEFPLLAVQARIRAVLRSGREEVSRDLAAALAGLEPPVSALDFETMSPAIPLYPGTRPYERIPFQWSLHRLEADGSLAHASFLADGRDDPRRPFAATLLAALHGSGPVLVYSGFEASVLGELARALPDLATALAAVRARLCDLHAVVRRHVYHPGFAYSFSLKAVAPALVPGFGYDDLEGIAAGGHAAVEFARIAAGLCDATEDARIRRALLAYCARDTLALVELHRALRARAQSVA